MGTVLAYAISCGTGRKAMELRSANIVSTGDSRKRSHCLVAQVPFLIFILRFSHLFAQGRNLVAGL